jgi:hypothetical protein
MISVTDVTLTAEDRLGFEQRGQLALPHDSWTLDLPFEQFLELQLLCGDEVYVTPQKVRVFSPEYEI